jgi:hypothetical protein
MKFQDWSIFIVGVEGSERSLRGFLLKKTTSHTLSCTTGIMKMLYRSSE